LVVAVDGGPVGLLLFREVQEKESDELSVSFRKVIDTQGINEVNEHSSLTGIALYSEGGLALDRARETVRLAGLVNIGPCRADFYLQA
jgi:hypothetical protein